MGNIFIQDSSDNWNQNDQGISNANNNGLTQNETDYINSIFRNNGFSPWESQEQIIKERTKKAKAYEAPIMIKRIDFKLEKDSIERDTYYITFKYTSWNNFDINIYFNASERFTSTEDIFIPSDRLTDQSIKIKNIPLGNNSIFIEKEAKIDLKYFSDVKIYDKFNHDIIIECIVKSNEDKIKCKLASYWKVIKLNKNGFNDYKVKCDWQKWKVKNVWFDMHDVYGLEGNETGNNECEACYTNKKNSIFLPCMHSYACSDCAVYVRIRGNKCPLCRQRITDTLLIEDRKDGKEKTEEKRGK